MGRIQSDPSPNELEPMPSHDPRVDAYIERQAVFAQTILVYVRELVHEACPDVEETIKWSMPAYTLGGKIVLITAGFKAHVALNFWRGQELRGDKANAEAMTQALLLAAKMGAAA